MTWDLLAGTNQIRNLHATGPLSIQLANDDWTLSFGCDAYSKAEADALLAPLASEVWVSNEILAALAAYSTTVQVGTAISDALGAYSSTAEMNTAISDAVDALNVGQYQDAGGVQFLIDQALLAYWTQAEVSSFVAGELANYVTSSSVTSAISSALSSYDDSSQVDSKIITALLDFYTQAEFDQQITNALGNVNLSNYYTEAETQSYVASELLAFYPRSELDSQLTATFLQYWTSGRVQTEINDAIAGAGFLTQAQADTRYFAVSANASFESLVRTNVTPPMIKALLPRAPLASSSITATQQIESDLRVQAPLLCCDPAASVLTVTGGTQGVLVDDTLWVNGVIIAPEAGLPFLSLSGGSSGVQVLSPLLEQIAVVPNGSVGIVARNAAATGDASLILDSNAQNGLVELKALAGGGVQMNTLFQFMSFNTTNGLANLAIEPNIGGSNNGELIFGYGFVNLSDKALKTNVRDLSEKELQETFDAVEPHMYDRIEGGKDQIGFIAQEVQATPLGERVCKTKNLDGRELMTLDYQKLNVVLWGVVKSLQKRVEKLEKKKRGRS